MKIVLDTNVLVSDIFFSGPPYQILKAWQERIIKIATSEEILLEYQRVVKELSSQFPAININQILKLVTMYTDVVDTHRFPIRICENPDDDKFISCALASKSKIIVSGDKHLVKISGYQGIGVIKPRDFLENHLKQK